MILLTDTSRMPFGKYKGKEMADVPASYLIRYMEECKLPDQRLKAYIIDNWQALQNEIKNER